MATMQGMTGDNWRRFAALSAVAADVAAGAVKGWQADLVHAHDWQTAMTAAYVRHGRAPKTPVVLTVHNLAFQGRFDAGIFPDLGLPASAFAVDGVEYYGGVGFLKAGLQYADAITTVSPTYADEIRTPAFGMGLDGLLRGRGDAVQGIVNGIDTTEWDPATDSHLAAHFSSRSLGPRAANRRMIEKRFALKRGKGPIFAIVSRLTWQKGTDLIVDAIDHIVAHGARLVALGSGDSAFEGALMGAATGILHPTASGDALKAAISRAIALFHAPGVWQAIRKQGMKADFGWGRSSARYAALYRSLVDRSVTR